MSLVALLGPQRLQPTVSSVLASLRVEGDVASITAGWQEREAEVEELERHLGRPTIRLELYRRAERIARGDPELSNAQRERQDRLQGLQELYRIRLSHALEAARELFRREGDEALLAPEREAAIEALRTLDRHHVARIAEIHEEFEAHWRLSERALLARERREVAAAVERSAAVLVAGGHVAVLLNRLRLFELTAPLASRPVVAWSAGAMALSERVVLFHDSPPQGPGNAEILDRGLGLFPGLVPLPHARRRLRLPDRLRAALLARRFAPAACVPMDEGAWVSWDGRRWRAAPGTSRIDGSGALRDLETA